MESLHDFFVKRLHDFFLVGRLRDFFVKRLLDFVCGEGAWCLCVENLRDFSHSLTQVA